MSEPKSRRLYAGPAILSYGFRPFFLAGALWAVVAVMLWLPQYFGEFSFTTAFQPLDWHAHEALFGYVAAVVTGFLLTAVPNWTGRLPLQGRPLLLLLAVWLAGRVAVAFSGQISAGSAAALVDCAFLALVCAAIAREIIAGKNYRNLKVLIFVGLLFAANVVFHIEAHVSGSATYGRRFGVAADHRAGHADWRTRHSELHPHLSRAARSRPAAEHFRPLRRGLRRRLQCWRWQGGWSGPRRGSSACC